jgi:hypothetical protein
MTDKPKPRAHVRRLINRRSYRLYINRMVRLVRVNA